MIKESISTIDTSTNEGKLLISAMSILTVSDNLSILGNSVNGRQLTPDEMLSELKKVSELIYSDKPELI